MVSDFCSLILIPPFINTTYASSSLLFQLDARRRTLISGRREEYWNTCSARDRKRELSCFHGHCSLLFYFFIISYLFARFSSTRTKTNAKSEEEKCFVEFNLGKGEWMFVGFVCRAHVTHWTSFHLIKGRLCVQQVAAASVQMLMLPAHERIFNKLA